MEQLSLINKKNKVEIAIDRLKEFEPTDGYYLAFSGGKDSQCIYHLSKEAGVKFDAYYNLTSVDPPELVQFIKKNYPDVIIEMPKMSMWRLIEKKTLPPTRLMRYCCDYLKEGGGIGRFVVTGVRWAESSRRKNTRKTYEIFTRNKKDSIKTNDNEEARMMFENCIKKGKFILNPIVDWEDSDVWDYIKSRKIEYCHLYDEGETRLGCIGCPLSGSKQMQKDFIRYPKYKQNYIKAFDKMLIERERKALPTTWKTGEEVMDWWLYGEAKKEVILDGQIEIDED